jgi:hypothetical protein
MNDMDKSSFRLVLGDSPVVKVIDFFLDNREFDYSLTDIARNADVGWVTLHQFWKDLVRLGLVKRTRRIGRAELYKLDISNPIVKKLSEIDFAVSTFLAKKSVKKQKVDIR